MVAHCHRDLFHNYKLQEDMVTCSWDFFYFHTHQSFYQQCFLIVENGMINSLVTISFLLGHYVIKKASHDFKHFWPKIWWGCVLCNGNRTKVRSFIHSVHIDQLVAVILLYSGGEMNKARLPSLRSSVRGIERPGEITRLQCYRYTEDANKTQIAWFNLGKPGKAYCRGENHI